MKAKVPMKGEVLVISLEIVMNSLYISLNMQNFWARDAGSEATIWYLRDIAQVQLFVQNLPRWGWGRVKITKPQVYLWNLSTSGIRDECLCRYSNKGLHVGMLRCFFNVNTGSKNCTMTFAQQNILMYLCTRRVRCCTLQMGTVAFQQAHLSVR